MSQYLKDNIYYCCRCHHIIGGSIYLFERRYYCSYCLKKLQAESAEKQSSTKDDVHVTDCVQEYTSSVDNKDNEKEQAEAEQVEAELADLLSWDDIFSGISSYVIGQEQAKRRVTTALYIHELRCNAAPEAQNMLPKANLLICGSTGTGKTELFRAASKVLNIPLVIADATELTGPGYRGTDLEDFFMRLYLAADKDLTRAQHGILFLDEFDKQVCHRSNEQIMSYGRLIQQSLLKAVEGKTVEIPVEPGDKKSRHILFDTSGVLFVFAGAHDGLRKTEKEKSHAIGFCVSAEENCKQENEAKKPLGPEDLIRYGYIPELAGRIPNIIELEPLSVANMVRILTEPVNSAERKYKALAAEMGVELAFEEEALKLIAEEGLKFKTGARGVIVLMEQIINEKIIAIARNEITETLTITRTDVEAVLADNRNTEKGDD